VRKFGSQTLVQFYLEIWRKFNSKWGTWNYFEPERLHCTTSRRAAPRRARSPRPPHGPERRGSLPPAGPCAVGLPASNRRPDPLPSRHVLMPAAPANQRRRHRTRAAPLPASYWPSLLAPPLPHAATRWATTPVTPPQGTRAYKGANLTAARLAPTPSRHCRRRRCSR
jgi:hypothetical protein